MSKAKECQQENNRDTPALTTNSHQSRIDTMHRGSVKHNFRGNPTYL